MGELASELLPWLKQVGGNWLSLVMAVIVMWLVVTRLVETSEGLAKFLGPLGRKIQASYQKRQDRYRRDVTQEAKILAVELLPKVVPSDYEVVKNQLRNVITRVEDLEHENTAMRAFIVSDEEWHFRWSLAVATAGLEEIARDLPVRYNWSEFLQTWKTGWRPHTL